MDGSDIMTHVGAEKKIQHDLNQKTYSKKGQREREDNPRMLWKTINPKL